MTQARIAGGIAVAVIVILAMTAGYQVLRRGADRPAASPSSTDATGARTAEVDPSFLYGRVTTVTGVTYEGRLRWGSGEEAYWSDFFNGRKDENRWLDQVSSGQLPTERETIEILGVELWDKERQIDPARPFMARFGDIARVEGSTADVRVTLKSGTVVVLNRFDSSDFDDGVRVWDTSRGVADLDSRMIRSIEFLSSPTTGPVPDRLYGTVRTQEGDFTGFILWNRTGSLGTDELEARTAGGDPLSLRFDTVRSIARESRDSSRVTRADGSEVVLSGSGDGHHNRGLYVDDLRYGRVLVSWDAFQRVDFSPSGKGPAGNGPDYDDFPAGHELIGSVTTHDGRRLAGRLVFDLDESETTETLDAPSGGVDYFIPFGLIGSIEPIGAEEGTAPSSRVMLHSGEELRLERAGDLGDRNGGMLIFIDGRDSPEYLPWADVERIELTRPAAMYPPIIELSAQASVHARSGARFPALRPAGRTPSARGSS